MTSKLTILGFAAVIAAISTAACSAEPAKSAKAAPVAAAPVAVAATPAVAAPVGSRLFLRCAACHQITDTPVKKIGPNLLGVVGRKAGSVPGFNYSPAMKASNLVWDEATLDKWLTRPTALVPGTAMAYAGMPKPEERKALIAYLKKPKP